MRIVKECQSKTAMKNYIAGLVLLFFFFGCGENTNEPNGSDRLDPLGNGFAIVQITSDTLYQGETGWLRMNKIADVASLSLFVHTIPFTIDKISGDTVFFQVSREAVTSKVRLFNNGTLAGGSFTLHVIPQHIADLNTIIWIDSSQASHGHYGDPIVLVGANIPMRRGEVSVRINGMLQPIEFQDDRHIVSRLAEGTTSGQIVVITRGKEHRLANFEVLQSDGVPFGSRIEFMKVKAWDVSATGSQTLKSRTFFQTLNFLYGEQSTQPVDAKIERNGDVIQASASWNDGASAKTFDLNLKQETGSELSGTIVYTWWYQINTNDTMRAEYSIKVDRIRWYRQGNTYRLYAIGPDIAKHVTLLHLYEASSTDEREYTAVLPSNRGYFELIFEE